MESSPVRQSRSRRNRLRSWSALRCTSWLPGTTYTAWADNFKSAARASSTRWRQHTRWLAGVAPEKAMSPVTRMQLGAKTRPSEPASVRRRAAPATPAFNPSRALHRHGRSADRKGAARRRQRARSAACTALCCRVEVGTGWLSAFDSTPEAGGATWAGPDFGGRLPYK